MIEAYDYLHNGINRSLVDYGSLNLENVITAKLDTALHIARVLLRTTALDAHAEKCIVDMLNIERELKAGHVSDLGEKAHAKFVWQTIDPAIQLRVGSVRARLHYV